VLDKILNIRALAAIAFIAALPVEWQTCRNAFNSREYWPILLGGLAIAGAALLATLPLFHLALSLNSRPLHFPLRSRIVAIVGVVCFSVYILDNIREALENRPTLQTMIGQFSNLAQVLLLIAFYRHADDAPRVDLPGLVSFSAKAAAVVYGLVLAFVAIGQLFAPLGYPSAVDSQIRAGAHVQTFANFIGELLVAVFTAFAMFAVPFMVWETQFRTQAAKLPTQRL
jgi:hypothetical protein